MVMEQTAPISLPPPAAPQPSAPASAAPPVAPGPDDSDQVEKAWVDKVKQVVRRSRGDPYRQNLELTQLKADYLKQRYNKIIKVEQ